MIAPGSDSRFRRLAAALVETPSAFTRELKTAERPAPPLPGEHTADVLSWLGCTIDGVRDLKTKGVLQ